MVLRDALGDSLWIAERSPAVAPDVRAVVLAQELVGFIGGGGFVLAEVDGHVEGRLGRFRVSAVLSRVATNPVHYAGVIIGVVGDGHEARAQPCCSLELALTSGAPVAGYEEWDTVSLHGARQHAYFIEIEVPPLKCNRFAACEAGRYLQHFFEAARALGRLYADVEPFLLLSVVERAAHARTENQATAGNGIHGRGHLRELHRMTQGCEHDRRAEPNLLRAHRYSRERCQRFEARLCG